MRLMIALMNVVVVTTPAPSGGAPIRATYREDLARVVGECDDHGFRRAAALAGPLHGAGQHVPVAAVHAVEVPDYGHGAGRRFPRLVQVFVNAHDRKIR